MRHVRGSLLLASFLAGAPLLAMTALPAQAQFSASISFDSFHGTLAGYGDWLYSDRWGEVWRPTTQDRDPDWRPYWAGHWVPTREYGWTWISDEGEWGDIAYHYGRWVYDPDDGWLWLPGYVWAPAWVVWRSAGPDLGWMPMPPDRAFLGPSFSVSVGFGDWNDIGGYYGYSDWYGPSFDQQLFSRLWVFVPGDRIADPGFRRYALPRPQTINIIQNSRNITNYTVVNNVIVNRSVTPAVAPQVRAAQPVPANTVLRNTRLVTPVNQGEQLQARARQERPHGTGQVGSAPPPTPQVIRTLSTRPVPVKANARSNAAAPGNAAPARGGERHLFSQANAQELQTRARGGQQQPGAAPTAPQPNAQPGAQPNAPRPGAPPNAQPAPGAQPNAQTERNNPRNENRPGPERQPSAAPPPANAPEAGRPTPPPENPSTEDRRGRNAERPPRALPGEQPAAPPPAIEQQRPRAMPESSAPREQPQRDQRQMEPRAMEQRMPDRAPERSQPPPREQPAQREMPPQRDMPPPREAAPPREMPPSRESAPPREMPPAREAAPPREMPPPREQARPQAQPREVAPPREQARPNTPPPDRGRGQDRGRGNDRPDDNR